MRCDQVFTCETFSLLHGASFYIYFFDQQYITPLLLTWRTHINFYSAPVLFFYIINCSPFFFFSLPGLTKSCAFKFTPLFCLQLTKGLCNELLNPVTFSSRVILGIHPQIIQLFYHFNYVGLVSHFISLLYEITLLLPLSWNSTKSPYNFNSRIIQSNQLVAFKSFS